MKLTSVFPIIFFFLGSGLAAPAVEIRSEEDGLISRESQHSDLTTRVTPYSEIYSWVSDSCPSSEHVYTYAANSGTCTAVPGSSTVVVTIPSGCKRE